MKKVKKFGRGGDIVTALGVGLIGKALYDKYKGKDDDEKEMEAVGGPSRRARTIEEQIGRKAEPKAESREEYLSKKTTPIKETGTFKGSDTDEPDLDYKDKTPKPVVKKAAPKKAEPVAQPKKAEPAAQPKKIDLPKPGQSKVVGEGEFKPFPKDVKKPEPPVTGKSTPEDTSKKATKYGIGPYGAFGSIHKAISEYKTPAEIRSEERRKREQKELAGMKKGGMVKSSASKRADGIAQRGKTRGRIC